MKAQISTKQLKFNVIFALRQLKINEKLKAECLKLKAFI
jgi:hypothetical protein